MWAAVTPNSRLFEGHLTPERLAATRTAPNAVTISTGDNYDKASTNLLCCGFPLPVTMTTVNSTASPREKIVNVVKVIITMIFDKFPRQIYLNALLHLPALYYSRVSRILHDAEETAAEVRKLYTPIPKPPVMQELVEEEKGREEERRQTELVAHFKSTWESFIDSTMREWKTLNIVSVLLLSYVK
jgi:hypothetical protein